MDSSSDIAAAVSTQDATMSSRSSAKYSSDGTVSYDDDNDDGDGDGSSTVVTSNTLDTDDNDDDGTAAGGGDDTEEMIQIRQKAFDLLNKSGGPADRQEKREWPERPDRMVLPAIARKSQLQHQQQQLQQQHQQSYASPYQQQSAGEGSHPTHSAGASLPAFGTPPPHHHPPRDYPHHQFGGAARTADRELSITAMFINCVTDACRVSSTEIVKQGVALVEFGYQSVSSYRDKPLNGTYETIDTSQHGYGSGSRSSPFSPSGGYGVSSPAMAAATTASAATGTGRYHD